MQLLQNQKWNKKYNRKNLYKNTYSIKFLFFFYMNSFIWMQHKTFNKYFIWNRKENVNGFLILFIIYLF